MNDNPSLDRQVGVIANSLSSLMGQVRELSDSVRRLEDLQRVQNGNVARSIDRQNQHDNWHGINDEKIAGRVGVLELVDHDAKVRKGVWLSQWTALTATAALGATLATLIPIILSFLEG